MENFSFAPLAQKHESLGYNPGGSNVPKNWSTVSSRFNFYGGYIFDVFQFGLRANIQSSETKNSSIRLIHPNIAEIRTLPYEVPYNDMIVQKQITEKLMPIDYNSLRISQKVMLIKDIARALDFSHSNKIYNRKINEENIGQIEGIYKIIDFSEAYCTNFPRSKDIICFGQSQYTSPERTNLRSDGSEMTDLHELAMTTYYILGGNKKNQWIRFGKAEHMHNNPEQVLVQPRNMSDEAYDVIYRATYFDSEIRQSYFRNCNEFAEALAESLTSSIKADTKRVITSAMNDRSRRAVNSKVTRHLILPIQAYS